MFKTLSLGKVACLGLLLLGIGSVANATPVATNRTVSSSTTAGDLTVRCQPGETASGGGYKFVAGTVDMHYNAPIGDGTQGWTIRYSATPEPSTLQFLAVVWVVCLSGS